MSSATVLIVDDDAHVRQSVRLILTKAGYSVIEACDGQEAIVLGTDDATTRRAFDLGGMVQHLAQKFEWAEALPDDDHVARLRARGIEERPERLEELVAEIGMSRALLEG